MIRIAPSTNPHPARVLLPCGTQSPSMAGTANSLVFGGHGENLRDSELTRNMFHGN